MTHLPSWSYQGTVPLTGDLSVLEAALHTGRVEAAELGYTGEPITIDTEEAMWREPDAGPDSDLLSAEQAQAAGLEFVPSVLRFRMDWSSEGSQEGQVPTVESDGVAADPVQEINTR